MKILYYDCFSGISGDMNLGALIDLGVDKDYLLAELKKLCIDEYTIKFITDQRKGITGTRAIVEIKHQYQQSNNQHHVRKHGSKSDLHNLKLKQFAISKENENTHHEHGRNFEDIKTLIKKSEVSQKVKTLSIKIFQKIAEAEAKIHGISIDNIHFHEVGAVDSIVDIVGAAICIDYIKPDKIFCSSIELGGGFVKCAHGTFPVPAPATAEILKGIPVKLGAINKETTTPTGAAILSTIVDEFTDSTNFQIVKTAYGIGYHDNPIPNVLRVYLGETDNQHKTYPETTTADLIECNIDDMNPEMYEYVMEKLFEAGADDIYFKPIIMKKSRPAITISVLCNPSISENIENIILKETSSLGLRKYQVVKRMLERDWEEIKTKWGKVRIKYGKIKGKTIKWKPEYDDCQRIARSNKISLSDVYREINLLINSRKS